AVAFDRALELDGGHAEAGEWTRKREIARANHAAGVNTDVPPVEPFERQTLLRVPDESGARLPETQNSMPPASRLAPVYEAIGKLGGRFVDRLWGIVTPLEHAARGARAGVWTDWYEQPLYRGLLTLASMRQELDEKNLVNTY